MFSLKKAKSAYVGTRQGLLTITDVIPSDNKPWYLAVCQCDCGNQVTLRLSSLIARNKKGAVSSCGCHLADARRKDITGMTFGNVKVIRLAMDQRPAGEKGSYWECECGLCGRHFYKERGKIIVGPKSCGCFNQKGAPYHRAIGINNGERYKQTQIVGGTNLCQVSVPDEVKKASNRSGVTGVSYATRDRVWRAEIGFCGKSVQRQSKSFEQACKYRALMRESRDEALDYLKSLPEMDPDQKRDLALKAFHTSLNTKLN